MYDRFIDIACYLMLMPFVQAMLSLGILLLLIPIGFIKGWVLYSKFLLHIILFNVSLLFFGCIGNSIWMLLTYNKLYVSADTVVDYFPFYPFGQWVLDQTFGSFRGNLLGSGSVSQLQIIWVAITSFVWSSAIAVHIRLRRILVAQQFTPADGATRRR
jgi:hypothetical protein